MKFQGFRSASFSLGLYFVVIICVVFICAEARSTTSNRALKIFGVPEELSSGEFESGESKEFSRHLREVLRDPRGDEKSASFSPRPSKQFDRLFNLQFNGLADLLRRPPVDNCPPCSCGVNHREERIVGGSIAEVNSYPWLAALQYRQKFYCSGTLISNRHILTAAHCVHGVPKDQIMLVLGEHDRNETDESGTQYRKIESLVKHPKFQRATFNNDIAILKLDRPVRFDKYISPACLPLEYEDEDFDGHEGMVAGWGRTEEKGKPSHILREVRVPIITNEECKKTKYQSEKSITDNMMCAGYEEGKLDACQGDSGGPLNWEPDDSNKEVKYVIGIVSWGQGCARPSSPGIYTRVTKYLEFIRMNTLESCYCSNE